ncbi:MAG: hypothetical protein CMH56_12010 [Myxococcales bacterium]|nr:hypothetical protein [Myxococcales bacterium]
MQMTAVQGLRSPLHFAGIGNTTVLVVGLIIHSFLKPKMAYIDWWLNSMPQPMNSKRSSRELKQHSKQDSSKDPMDVFQNGSS